MTTPPDSIDILAEFLKVNDGSGGLYELTADRVWTPTVRAGFSNTQAALVINNDSEEPEAPLGVLGSGFLIRCFGGDTTEHAAKAVALRLYGRLHGGSGPVASGRIIRARCLTMFPGPLDPDTGWPSHLAKYRAIVEPL